MSYGDCILFTRRKITSFNLLLLICRFTLTCRHKTAKQGAIMKTLFISLSRDGNQTSISSKEPDIPKSQGYKDANFQARFLSENAKNQV